MNLIMTALTYFGIIVIVAFYATWREAQIPTHEKADWDEDGDLLELLLDDKEDK